MNKAVETAMANSKADTMFDAVWPNALGHRIELEWDEARQYIRRIEAYNNFDWEKVHRALDMIDTIIPRMEYTNMVDGKPNLNHGRRNFRIEVGRERSPVIYIERYEFDHGFVQPQPQLTKEQCQNICDIMEKAAEADEFDFKLEEETKIHHVRHVEFRFWWD
jgi:hypothetical protein